MADIHVGEMTLVGGNKGIVNLVYHLPIDSPKSGIVPTSSSAIEELLDSSEIEALASGQLAEVSRTIAIDRAMTQSDIIAAVRADWQNTKVDYNNQYSFKYKFYGSTINATA